MSKMNLFFYTVLSIALFQILAVWVRLSVFQSVFQSAECTVR